MTAQDWRDEAAAVAVAYGYAQCQVCHTPILRKEHDPVEVELDDGGPGLIHGAFDCTDEPRCEQVLRGDSSGGEWSAQCILPATHLDAGTDCIPGEPS